VVRSQGNRRAPKDCGVSLFIRITEYFVMFGIRITRTVRLRLRAAAVWAAMPLVVLNGRTVVGCGCTGHFKAVCHCSCCSGMQDGSKQHGKNCCSCCGSHSANNSKSKCPCCDRSELPQRCDTANGNSHCPSHQSLERHHCKSIALYEVIRFTAASSADAGDLHASIFTLADLTSPALLDHSRAGLTVDFNTGPPPNDLVVTLRRLIL
jgi:hypothetical protein